MISENFINSFLKQAGVLDDNTLVLQFLEENKLHANSMFNKESVIFTILNSYLINNRSIPDEIKEYIVDNIDFLTPDCLLIENNESINLMSLLLMLNNKRINDHVSVYINEEIKDKIIKLNYTSSIIERVLSEKNHLDTLKLLSDNGIKIKKLNDFHLIKYAMDDKTLLWMIENEWVDFLYQDQDYKTAYHYISLLKSSMSEKIYKNLNKKFIDEGKETEHNSLLVYTFAYSRKLSLFKTFSKNKKLTEINYNGENILSSYINAKILLNKNLDSHNTFRLDTSKYNYILKRIEECEENDYLDCKNEWSAHYLLFKHSYLNGFEEKIFNSIKVEEDFHFLINNMFNIINSVLNNEKLSASIKLSYILSFLNIDVVGLCMGLIYKSQNNDGSYKRFNYNSMYKEIKITKDFDLIFEMFVKVLKEYYSIMKNEDVSRKNVCYSHKFKDLIRIPNDYKSYIETKPLLKEGLYYLYYSFMTNTTSRCKEKSSELFDIMTIPSIIERKEIISLREKSQQDYPFINAIFENYIIKLEVNFQETTSKKKKRM